MNIVLCLSLLQIGRWVDKVGFVPEGTNDNHTNDEDLKTLIVTSIFVSKFILISLKVLTDNVKITNSGKQFHKSFKEYTIDSRENMGP